MKKNLFLWQLFGITFTALLGTLFHFLYQWTNLKFFATFSAVNESTWEHMKILFIPAFAFAILQSFFFFDAYPCFWVVKLVGVLIGTFLIPILFYTLTGCFGKLPAAINVTIFFVAIIVAFTMEYFLLKHAVCFKDFKAIPIAILTLFFIAFIIFTFHPPKLPLFLDPVTKGYGIVK